MPPKDGKQKALWCSLLIHNNLLEKKIIYILQKLKIIAET